MGGLQGHERLEGHALSQKLSRESKKQTQPFLPNIYALDQGRPPVPPPPLLALRAFYIKRTLRTLAV